MDTTKISKTKDIKKFRNLLLPWYRENQRKLPWRESKDPYHIWISEVMLQQTQVVTATPYFHRFMEKFPTIAALAKADLQLVLKMWEGLGYYARARNFHKAANIVAEKYDGRIPGDYEDFRQLPGVGGYIAAAVQSIAFGHPYAVVDGNVKRVLSRLFEIEAPANDTSSLKIYQQVADELLARENAGDFNQAVMELGAMVCRPQQPDCSSCPLISCCAAFANSTQDKFPIKKPRKKVPEYHHVIGVIEKDGRLLITKRPENGLLGGFWEFPGGEVQKNDRLEDACLREIKSEVNLDVSISKYLTRVRHAYTHFKVIADVFICQYVSGEPALNEAVDYRWVDPDDIDSYPFPKINHKFIPFIKSNE